MKKVLCLAVVALFMGATVGCSPSDTKTTTTIPVTKPATVTSTTSPAK